MIDSRLDTFENESRCHPRQFIRRRLMISHELKHRIQRLNVACPTLKHRDNTTEAIRRHDETVKEPMYGSFYADVASPVLLRDAPE